LPNAGLVSGKVRGSGQMSPLISLDTIAYAAGEPIPLAVAGKKGQNGCQDGRCGCGGNES
jgi:hypothetical protein